MADHWRGGELSQAPPKDAAIWSGGFDYWRGEEFVYIYTDAGARTVALDTLVLAGSAESANISTIGGTFYVRKTGSDSNDGLSSSDAFLTIDKAANIVGPGATVYVGAGVYRELITMDISGTSTNQISFIADVAGSQTGDAGLIIVSAYDAETGTASRSACIDPDGQTFITWRGFSFVGGTDACVYSGNSSNDNYEGCIYEDCSFTSGNDAVLDKSIHIYVNGATTPTNDGLIVRRCTFYGNGIRMTYDQNESGEQNLKMAVESCVFVGNGCLNTSAVAFMWDLDSSGTYSSGGVSINNCTILGYYYAVYVDHGASATHTIDVRNCWITSISGLVKQTSDDGAMTSDYNRFHCTTAHSNVTIGANDTVDMGSHLMGSIGDQPLHRYWGWSPYRPWEPVRFQDDSYDHHVIGTANTGDAPAFDLYNESRPMHGTVDDVGAVEGRARPEIETTTVLAGNNAMRFDGAGFQDILFPVNPERTMVSIYGRYDSSYTGTNPQLKVLNIPGVADQSDTISGSADTWEQMSLVFTPTSQGTARIRVVSNDTSAGGECYFDDLRVSNQYYQKVLATETNSLVAYWPLWDTDGNTTVEQIASTGIAAGSRSNDIVTGPGIGDGRTAIYFDGSSGDNINITTSALWTSFGAGGCTEGSIMIWVHPAVGYWLTGYRDHLYLRSDYTGTTEYARLGQGYAGDRLSWYRNPGTSPTTTGNTDTNWFCMLHTWDSSGGVAYKNGSQAGTAGVPTTWNGTGWWANGARIGCTESNTYRMLGWLAHCAIWTKKLTSGQATELATLS